jgi:hypothetical protein
VTWRPLAVLVIVGVVCLACGGAGQVTPTSIPGGSPTGAGATVATPSALATPGAVTSPEPASNAPSLLPSDAVVVDLSLLDHLPATVDGLPVEPDAETSASIATSPGLASDASAIAIARVVSATSDDLAIASVVRLRTGPFSEASYDVWRRTYDRAACEPAGGVATTAERRIAGRDLFVGACNGGAQTYHVALGDDVLVSVTAIGSRGFGDLLVAGLRE